MSVESAFLIGMVVMAIVIGALASYGLTTASLPVGF